MDKLTACPTDAELAEALEVVKDLDYRVREVLIHVGGVLLTYTRAVESDPWSLREINEA